MNTISPDVWLEIVQHLTVSDLSQIGQSCRRLRQLSTDERVWKIVHRGLRMCGETWRESVRVQHNLRVDEKSWIGKFSHGYFEDETVVLKLFKSGGRIFSPTSTPGIRVRLTQFIETVKVLEKQRGELYRTGLEPQAPPLIRLLTRKTVSETPIRNIDKEYALYHIRKFTNVAIKDYASFNTLKEEHGCLILVFDIQLLSWHILYVRSLRQLIDELSRLCCILSPDS